MIFSHGSIRRFWLCLAIAPLFGPALFGQQAVAADNGAKAPIVVELFTSQSCKMCPPADAFLTDLAKEEDIIALSLPVDMWDFLGFKDPIADPAHTLRHKAYNTAIRERQAFTPQMVIDGKACMPGSKRDLVRKKIKQRKKSMGARAAVSIEAVAEGDNHVAVRVDAASEPLDRDATIYLVAYRSHHGTVIEGGLNEGKVIDYTNAVFSIEPIGTWNGTPFSRTMPIPQDEDGVTEGVAVLVQSGEIGEILGAAKHDLLHATAP